MKTYWIKKYYNKITAIIIKALLITMNNSDILLKTTIWIIKIVYLNKK